MIFLRILSFVLISLLVCHTASAEYRLIVHIESDEYDRLTSQYEGAELEVRVVVGADLDDAYRAIERQQRRRLQNQRGLLGNLWAREISISLERLPADAGIMLVYAVVARDEAVFLSSPVEIRNLSSIRGNGSERVPLGRLVPPENMVYESFPLAGSGEAIDSGNLEVVLTTLREFVRSGFLSNDAHWRRLDTYFSDNAQAVADFSINQVHYVLGFYGDEYRFLRENAEFGRRFRVMHLQFLNRIVLLETQGNWSGTERKTLISMIARRHSQLFEVHLSDDKKNLKNVRIAMRLYSQNRDREGWNDHCLSISATVFEALKSEIRTYADEDAGLSRLGHVSQIIKMSMTCVRLRYLAAQDLRSSSDKPRPHAEELEKIAIWLNSATHEHGYDWILAFSGLMSMLDEVKFDKIRLSQDAIDLQELLSNTL